MSDIAVELTAVQGVLENVYQWMLKNKSGLTRDEAKRIFQRYRSGTKTPEQQPEDPSEEPPTPGGQDRQMAQILNYMQETTERLDRIEDDITYLKARVDAILKKI